jgi:fumarylacetoacetase
MTCWVPVPDGSDFPVENLPYGAFSQGDDAPRIGVAIGAQILDLAAVLEDEVFGRPTLNAFLSQGRDRWREVRERVTRLLTDEGNRAAVEPHLVPQDQARMHLPFEPADYVDFYASIDHAQNLGQIFRPEQEPLTPNWRWLPIGYHGRAGTLVVSGTPITRPCGQRKSPAEPTPVVGPSVRLDIEAELGFLVAVPSRLGQPVSIDDFREHVFGAVLVNDWSARDLQAWEYVPLGPFLGKSFATSLSPWVVPFDALEEAMIEPPAQDPVPPDYLRAKEAWGLDVELEVLLNGHSVSRPPYGAMYWTPAQMMAHMTENGASLRTGDFYASGTISGPSKDQRGSFIEMSWNGADPLELPDGSTRTFLEDGDTVTIVGTAPGAGGSRIGFGDVSGTIRAAPAADD